MKAPLYNQAGEKTGDVTLVKEIFEVEGSEGLVHSYLMYQQANARRPVAHILNKGDVRGGGKKPFAQKHTGRARQGSTRNPHMRGGGNAFGPKKWQNFEKMMNKGMRRKALFQILSSKASDGTDKISSMLLFKVSVTTSFSLPRFISLSTSTVLK